MLGGAQDGLRGGFQVAVAVLQVKRKKEKKENNKDDDEKEKKKKKEKKRWGRPLSPHGYTPPPSPPPPPSSLVVCFHSRLSPTPIMSTTVKYVYNVYSRLQYLQQRLRCLQSPLTATNVYNTVYSTRIPPQLSAPPLESISE